MPPSEAWEQALPLLLALCFLSFGFGYLLGSIPFGLILAKLAGLGDLRQIGSGNIGATNVLRTGNKGLAALTLLLDLLKGTAAVWVGSHFGPYAAMAAGLGAFLGHLFPVWLGFRGGKGVATYIGVLLGLYWPAAAAFSAIWLIVGLRHTLFLPRCAGGERGKRRDARADRPMAARGLVPAAYAPSLYPARRKYRAPGERRGGAHWREDRLRPRPSRRARAGSTIISASPGSG